MEIREVLTERRRYMELLLMGDEQEDMIELYLERGEMFALHVGCPCCCVRDNAGSGKSV